MKEHFLSIYIPTEILAWISGSNPGSLIAEAIALSQR